MSFRMEDGEYDLSQILVKPLYFALFANIIIPMILLYGCYYMHSHGGVENRIEGFADELYYAFGVLSVAQGGLALWWRHRRLGMPMIRRKETFEQDISDGLVGATKPVFLTIAAICIYGYVYFFLTGRFRLTLFLVLFSFVVFQVVRPRMGTLRKLIRHQKDLVEKGHFRS